MNIDEIALRFNSESLWLLNSILGVIMFGIALDLKVKDFKHVLIAPRAPLIGLAAQFILLPAFTFLLTLAIHPMPSIALGMILIASCPGGNISNFITHFARGNTAISISMTAISTVFAIFMTPFNISFWGGLNPETAQLLRKVNLDPIEMFFTVFLILGLPLFLGMFSGYRYPKWASKMKNFFKIFSIVSFLMFVVIAFASNFDIFLEYIGWVAAAVIIHNSVALSTGNLAGRLLRLNARDRRAVTIEVGIQNSALGLTLIFGFFPGLGGMALVAGAWGIWHILSGLIISTWWRHRPIKDTLIIEAQ